MSEVEVSDGHVDATPASIGSGEEGADLTSGVDTEVEKEGLQKEEGRGATAAAKRPITAVRRPGGVSATTKVSTTPATRVGGLSKPPSRPVSGSAVRKTATATTGTTSLGISHGSTTSTSATEDKKPAVPATKRSSIASHAAPSLSTSSSSNATARKPTASSTTSNTSRTITRPTLSTASSRASNSGVPTTASARVPSLNASTSAKGLPVSKLAASSIAKKAVNAPSSTSSNGVSATPNSSAEVKDDSGVGGITTDEVQELRTKLAESESTVEALKAEIEVAQSKLLRLGEKMQEESDAVMRAEEAIRAQHLEMIEKARAANRVEVEALQEGLAKLTAAYEEAVQSSSKSAKTADDVLERTKAAHTEEMTKLQAALDDTRNNASSTDGLMADLEKSKVETAKAYELVKSLRIEQESKKEEVEEQLRAKDLEKTSALEAQQKSLGAEHESSMKALMEAHQKSTEHGTSSLSDKNQKELQDLKTTHESKLAALQKEVNENAATKAELEAAHKKSMEIQAIDYEATLTATKAEYDSIISTLTGQQEELKSSMEELASLHGAVASLKAENSKLARSSRENETAAEQSTVEIHRLGAKVDDLQTKLTTSQLEVKALRETAADEANNLAASRAGHADRTKEANMLQEKLVAADKHSESLMTKHDQLKLDHAALVSDRSKELATLHEKHRKELESVSSDYQKEIDALEGNSDLKEKYEDLNTKYAELVKAHEDTTASRATALEKAEKDHAMTSKSLESQSNEHRKLIESLKENHEKDLDAAIAKARSEADATHDSELEKLRTAHDSSSADLKSRHAVLEENSAAQTEKLKTTEGALQAQLEKMSSSLAQTQEELDATRMELAQAKSAKVAAEADLDAFQNKKPDTTEIDNVRKELQALKNQHQAALMTAQQESAKATEEHLATKESLAKVQADAVAHRQASEGKLKTSQTDYKDMHDSMTQLVMEASQKASDKEMRVAELEATLKVKDAELAEAKTKASLPVEPPKAKVVSGLRASKFADAMDDDGQGAVTPSVSTTAVPEGEHDSSSAALASLALAQVTVAELEEMNSDLKSENLRMLQSITDLASSSSPTSTSHAQSSAVRT